MVAPVHPSAFDLGGSGSVAMLAGVNPWTLVLGFVGLVLLMHSLAQYERSGGNE